MESAEIKRIDITVPSKNVNDISNCEEFKTVVTAVRPDWGGEEQIIEIVHGGYMNNMLSVHLKDDPDKNDALLIRVTNHNDLYVLDSAVEVEGIKIASAAGCTPPIYAFFNNGFVQKLIDIEKADYEALYQEPNCRKLAALLAKLHSLRNKYEEIEFLDKEPVMFRRIQITNDAIPDDISEFPEETKILETHGLSKEWLQRELRLMKKHFRQGNMELVFGHTDVHMHNVIKDKQTGRFYLVDFEFCGINYDAYDFAYYKNMQIGFQILGVTSDWLPSEGDFKRLIRHYLVSRNQLHGKDDAVVTEEEVDAFYKYMLYLGPVYVLSVISLAVQELFQPVIKNVPRETFLRGLKIFCKIYQEQRHLMIPDDE